MLFAQAPADSLQMDSVVITASRTSVFATGIRQQRYDSLTLARYSGRALDELLSGESDLYIKSYGPGSLATSSFRGGSASHTALVWNGIAINNPSLALSDLSIIPVFFSDEISLQYGGSGTLWGSGNVGGAILMDSHLPADSGMQFSLSADAGSWNNSRIAAACFIGGRKAGFMLRAAGSAGKNDFPFADYTQAGAPRTLQKNAAFVQQVFLPAFVFRPNGKNEISVQGWIQSSHRQIPPALLQGPTAAEQEDAAYRLNASWKHYGERSKFIFRSALLNDHIGYEDSVISLYSQSASWTLVNEAEFTCRLSSWLIMQGGLVDTYTEAVSESFSRKRQNRTAAFLSFAGNLLHERLRYTLAFREEQAEGKILPFIPSAGIEWQFAEWISLRANGTRSYRLPSFNDLYWRPGGNPDLLPESGWSGDGGLNLRFRFGKWKLEGDFASFYRRMQNWIIWLPASNSVWTPQNALEVLSRGYEISAHAGYASGKWRLNAGFRMSHVISTNEKTASPADASLGKQLIYVPYDKIGTSAGLQWKSWLLHLDYNFTGFRYTSSDNSAFLPSFDLFSARLSWKGKILNETILLYAQAGNISDRYYELVLSRPMPGISFRCGLEIRFLAGRNFKSKSSK